ncbi:hypothetical protein E2C01_032518 [Portunus trituberculatus]|uniref:Uncharacterized protein n=1 Tax=Portunus trituberculatus TaxID=210409 RepID=A0A5B7F186_PORTR|nr:hypothetical protein [Portunus trituberculatus]
MFLDSDSPVTHHPRHPGYPAPQTKFKRVFKMTGEKTSEELQSEIKKVTFNEVEKLKKAEKGKTAFQELMTCVQSSTVAIKRKEDDLKENIRGCGVTVTSEDDIDKEIAEVTNTITHKKEVLKDIQNRANFSHQETSASISRISFTPLLLDHASGQDSPAPSFAHLRRDKLTSIRLGSPCFLTHQSWGNLTHPSRHHHCHTTTTAVLWEKQSFVVAPPALDTSQWCSTSSFLLHPLKPQKPL